MPGDNCVERQLFGGAISTCFPLRFQDVSDVRQVPDHQEAYVDPARDESIVIELLDLKHDVRGNGGAVWFLQDLASEQNAEATTVIEQSGVFTADGIRYRNTAAVMTTAIGEMKISKGRQGPEAHNHLILGTNNHVKVYVANLRLKEVGTDVLITAYEPFVINPLSESANSSGCTPMSEVFRLVVANFKVHDWNLFAA
ncbi:hypothetical protein MKW92_035077 [Papaver armeniacum]|nr:hypothetical protein MKW92_035077 [Papaver armeniacum]